MANTRQLPSGLCASKQRSMRCCPDAAALEHVRDDAVGHGLAVLRPGGAVLCGAARVVAEGAVQQQQREEGEEVEVGQRALRACRQAPAERGRQLRQVVEVPRQAPPACAMWSG